jgi:hypothetical protein
MLRIPWDLWMVVPFMRRQFISLHGNMMHHSQPVVYCAYATTSLSKECLGLGSTGDIAQIAQRAFICWIHRLWYLTHHNCLLVTFQKAHEQRSALRHEPAIYIMPRSERASHTHMNAKSFVPLT